MVGQWKGLDPKSGYRLAYHPHSVNHCPGCGQTQWLVGRSFAECAYCATAMPIVEGVAVGAAHPFREAPLAA